MRRLLAISDIHGELEKFERLLDTANYDPDHDQLLLLGDYIDRGPHSRGVIQKVRALQQAGAVALMGNHEKMMLDAFRNEDKAVERWFRNGARETLLSYGYPFQASEAEMSITPSRLEWTEELREVVSFIEKLPFYYETEEYIFVHAGVQPGVPLSDCDPHKLVWIREEFYDKYRGLKTVIFGHTPTKSLHGTHDVYFAANRIIGIDGACVYGGRLNGLELPSGQTYYVE